MSDSFVADGSMGDSFMQFASLGSGSDGNASVIRAGETLLLLDCGFSLKSLTQRLARLELKPEQITAALITHEHADHIRGVGPLARKYSTPIYMTAGTATAKCLGRVDDLRFVCAGDEWSLGELTIESRAVPHDAREPVQYIFRHEHRRLGVLTDLGSIPDELIEVYRGLDALVIEANHDPEMLARGPYPPSLKQRVGGFWGHLSNQQCVELVEAQDFVRLQHLVVAHISQKNNCVERVREAFAHLPQLFDRLTLACQEEGVAWRNIA